MDTALLMTTFRRPKQLRKTIEAVLSGEVVPRHLVIVDNDTQYDPAVASTIQGLVERCGSNTRFHYLPQSKNLGSSGGFRKAIIHALELNVDLFWLMDDDATPDHQALLALTEALRAVQEHDPTVQFAASRVLWRDGAPHVMNQPRLERARRADQLKAARYSTLRSTSFVSLAVSSQAVRTVGLPVEEFFIWYDDVEYSKRLAASFTGIYVPESLVTHETDLNVGSSTQAANNDNFIKYRCGIRNGIAAELAMKHPISAVRHALSLASIWSSRKLSISSKLAVSSGIAEIPRTYAAVRRTRRETIC